MLLRRCSRGVDCQRRGRKHGPGLLPAPEEASAPREVMRCLVAASAGAAAALARGAGPKLLCTGALVETVAMGADRAAAAGTRLTMP